MKPANNPIYRPISFYTLMTSWLELWESWERYKRSEYEPTEGQDDRGAEQHMRETTFE